MKIKQPFKYIIAVLGALMLEFGVSAQTYQTTDYTNTFDNNGNTGQYENNAGVYWYSIYQDYQLTVPPGTYNYPMTNDASVDADVDTNISGSLYVYTPFNSTSNHDQNVFYTTFGGLGPFDQSVQIPITLVTNISFKIHVDPRTKPDPDGNFGVITFGLLTTDYKSGANSPSYQAITIPGAATNGWVKLAETNSADEQAELAQYGTTNCWAVDFDYNNYGGVPTNPVGFWIDDLVVLTSSAPPPPPPPPSNSISGPFAPGLNLFAGTSSTLYNRENLETLNPSNSWINAGHPVSYSYTVSGYPIGKNDAFQTQIFLIPNPGTETAPDYSEADLVFFDMESTTNGAIMYFRFKTNEVNGNNQVYTSPGALASVSSSTAVGTWKATFNNNTNVTMLAPDGTSTNFNIPDLTLYFSQNPGTNIALYFGVQAGNIGGTQDHISVSNFSVTGSAGDDFNDNFVADNGVLNTSIWETNASYAPAVQLFAPQPGNQFFEVSWTSPALNYTLQYGTSFSPTNWQPVMINGVAPTPTRLGTNFNVIINTNELPGANNGAFFELIQPGQ